MAGGVPVAAGTKRRRAGLEPFQQLWSRCRRAIDCDRSAGSTVGPWSERPIATASATGRLGTAASAARATARLNRHSHSRSKVIIMHWIDPNCLPETQGAVEGFIVNQHGEIDSLLLAGPRPTPLLVCMPPHLAAAIEAEVKHGDTIRVRGVRPRQADIIAAVALTAGNGAMIVDDGPSRDDEYEPPHGDGKPQRMEADGVVRLSLYGPKGELRGALLQNGTVIRIGAKEAASIPELLCSGASVAVRGQGLRTKHGRVIAAEEIGPDKHGMKPVAAPKHPKHKDKPKHKKLHDERADAGASRR